MSPNPYLGPHETSVVVDLIRSVDPRVVIEFGVNYGRTARAILAATPTIETYIGVDVPFGYKTRLACQRSEVPLEAGRDAFGDARFFRIECPGGSTDLSVDDLEPIDAAFIDGDHSAGGVTHDTTIALDLLRPGGICVWHDYGNPAVEVTAVLDRLVRDGHPIEPVPNTWLAFMRKPR